MTNDDNLADTIRPKSDQLNADDLLTGPITVKVDTWTRGKTPEQPVFLHIKGRQPFKPCLSMRRVLIAAWGEKASMWVGKSMTLFADPSVVYGGARVGGIRISHVSDIAEPVSVMLTVSRGKRILYTVQPLVVKPENDAARKQIVERLWKLTAEKHGGNKAVLQQWLIDENFLSADPLEELSEVSAARLGEVLAAVEKKLSK